MDFSLQFGYGMMDHSRSLIKDWNGGTVILSPRDLSEQQLDSLSQQIRSRSGRVLFDPQFYLPHADHKRLKSHEYWPDDYETFAFWSGNELSNLLSKIKRLNRSLGCYRIILPGLYASVIDDDWLNYQTSIIEEAERLDITSEESIITVALSAETTKNIEQIHKIIDESEKWQIKNVYLIFEHPQGNYLVDDPVWIANVLDLIAGFRLMKCEVILGYCNHQMLIAACASASSIASGTWMNVRSFPPDKFRAQYEEEMKKRSTWYYCPQALSEYKIPFLDIAYLQGILPLMAPSSQLGSTYADSLFSGAQPTTVGFTEQSAFRHYLQCLKVQAESAQKNTFQATIDFHKRTLDDAETLLDRLHSAEIRGQGRDFKNMLEANRAALKVLESNRGAVLQRYWNRI